jgi:cell division protein ZapA (FtsZ GTPase activity inhibitor)
MMTESFQKFTLTVAGKKYPIKDVKREEERIYRKAGDDINKKIERYGAAFPSAELKDLLTMAAIHVAVENIRMEKAQDVSPVFDKIKALNNELEEYLKNNTQF